MTRKIPLFDMQNSSDMSALGKFMKKVEAEKAPATIGQVRSIIREELAAFFNSHAFQVQPPQKQEIDALTISRMRVSAREEIAKAEARKQEKLAKKRMAA